MTLEEDIALVRDELRAAQGLVFEGLGFYEREVTEETQAKFPARQAFERIVDAVENERA
jgi:hypothetical protein